MKFTVRDLLLVTGIVALAVGWWVDHARMAATGQRNEEYYEGELTRIGEEFSRMRERISDLEAKTDKRVPNPWTPAPNPPND